MSISVAFIKYPRSGCHVPAEAPDLFPSHGYPYRYREYSPHNSRGKEAVFSIGDTDAVICQDFSL